MLLAGILAGGCGEVHLAYGDYRCPEDPPGVVVEFVARGDGRQVAVAARGTLRDGPFVEQMRPADHRFAGAGRTYALAGGYRREGIYEVRVETAVGEVLTWSRVRVAADRCGPLTVVLQAELTRYDSEHAR
jgi:hypothetical protein